MGKTKPSSNPFYGDEIDHPILIIGSSYSVLCPNVAAWLEMNCDSFDFRMEEGEYCLFFQYDEDAIAFKMRWL